MRTLEYAGFKATVKALLENASLPKLDWSIQGMGMLRLRLAPDVRLHIWDSRLRVPGVSMIHDHQQWDLHSDIIAGELANYRYIGHADGVLYHYRTLRAGYGCQFVDTGPQDVLLYECPGERYVQGESYGQHANEIHRTDAEDGTVTIMTQTRQDSDRARVFWRHGEEWGSAEPRPATSDEVLDVTRAALARWFS